jgi:hypothetical protein
LAAVGLACPAHTPEPEDAPRDPEVVLGWVRSRLAGIQSLTLEGFATAYSDQGARKGKVAILARRPADLHMMALDPTDNLVAALASNGKHFVNFERGAAVCYTGEACPANVARLLPVALPGEAVVDLLLGGAPIIPHTKATLRWDPRAGAHQVTLEGADGRRQNLWVLHKGGEVRRMAIDEGGSQALEVEFDDYRPVDGVQMPGELALEMARGHVDLKLSYRQVSLRDAHQDDAFQMACPAGTRVETLPCDPGP